MRLRFGAGITRPSSHRSPGTWPLTSRKLGLARESDRDETARSRSRVARTADRPDVTFNFKPVKVHAGVAYISGHGPFDGPNVLVQGLSVSTSRWKRDTKRRRLVAL